MRHWMTRSALFLATVTILAQTSVGADVKKKAPSAKDPDSALFLAPVNGAVDIKAGTLETRFSLDYSFSDYLRPQASSCVPFYFLHLPGKDGTLHRVDTDPWIAVYMYQKRGGNSIMLANNYYYRESSADPTIRSASVGIAGNQDTGPWLKQGEWHALAATWELDGKGVLQLEVFLDGKSSQRRAFPTKDSKTRPIANDDLMGIGGLGLSPATLLSYRLSNRVRTKAEIASDKPLAPDEATTFFLDGTAAAQYKVMTYRAYTEKLKDKKVSIKDKGVFIGKFKIVSTPQGKAIQFYEKSSR